MPVTQDDALVNRVIENDRRVGLFIIGWQHNVVQNNWHVQNYTRRQAMSRVPKEVKDGLKAVNTQHLERMRTGFFDEIFRAGGRSIDSTFFMTERDKRRVQTLSVDYYTKMRNARAFAARDTERFVSHVWEDTKARRRMFGRTTQYLEHYGFKGRPGTLEFVEDPSGIARMDKRFEEVDKRFEAMDKRFETMDKRFEAMDKRFDTLTTLIINLQPLQKRTGGFTLAPGLGNRQ